MNIKKRGRRFITQLVTLCMILPMLMPILACAETDAGVLVSDGTEYSLKVAPEENELGLTVSAYDAAEAFGKEYRFDAENKAFEIYDEEHGTVVLMHNATSFFSGDSVFECAPYFYVKDGEPMVELGFFCTMFGASYTYSEQDGTITIDKDTLGDDVAKAVCGDKTVALYVEPIATDNGFKTGLRELAACMDIDFEYDEANKTAVLTAEDGTRVELTDGAETFTSTYGEFGCGRLFNIEDDIPMIDVRFFCELFGSSYEYDEGVKKLTLNKGVPFEEETDASDITLMADAKLSGKIKYSKGAPSNGLDVKLILQQISTRTYSYYGTKKVAGQSYVLGTTHFDYGDKSKSYSYSVSSYYSSTYNEYCLFYAEDGIGEYGYYNTSGTTSGLTESPMYTSVYYSNAKLFSSNSSASADIDINSDVSALTGTISLEDDYAAPEGGLDVDLILQTRSRTYAKTYMYGSRYYTYDLGQKHNLGTTHFDKGEKVKDFKYLTEPCYTSSDYEYFTLFYDADGSDCVQPYGYYDSDGDIVTMNISPLDSINTYLDSMAFNLMGSSNVNIVLPLRSDYNPNADKAAEPLASAKSGNLKKGTRITLSSATDGAQIYYTTNGTDPTISSTIYSGPITINEDTLLKAVAVKSGYKNSVVSSYRYIVSNGEYAKFIDGEKTVYGHGSSFTCDSELFTINGELFAPARAIAEAFLASAEWDSVSGKMTFILGNNSITLNKDEKDCIIRNELTYVNVCTVAEALFTDDYIIKKTPISVSVIEDSGDKPLFKIGTACGRAGDEVTVDVSLSGNVGIAGYAVGIVFDKNKLTPIEVKNGSVFSENITSNIDQGGEMSTYDTVYVSCIGSRDVTNNGTLFSIKFKIKDNVEDGVIDLMLTYNRDNIANQQYQTVNIASQNGYVEVVSILKGDVFQDGVINAKDAIRLAQYLAKWNIELTDAEKKAADIVEDGVINAKDAIRLAQYLAKWDITLD